MAASYPNPEQPPTELWHNGVDPAALYGWRGWDDVMDWGATAPDDDDDESFITMNSDSENSDTLADFSDREEGILSSESFCINPFFN